MKKFLSFILLLGVFFVAYSAAPSDEVTNAAYEYSKDRDISAAAAYDTIGVAANDSTTLLLDFVPEKGWEYIYVRDAITGTGSDSAYYYVQLRCKDKVRGAILYDLRIDTVTASAGEAIKLPLGETALGVAFDLKLVTINGSTGTQVILNRNYIFKRRPVVSTKPWM